jgi:hypothetical protein
VAVFVILNAFISQFMARRGRSWKSVASEFGVMLVVNFALGVGLALFDRLVGIPKVEVPFSKTLFFLFLTTILIVLFDRYHTVFWARRLLPRQRRKDGAAQDDAGGKRRGSEGGSDADLGTTSAASPMVRLRRRAVPAVCWAR